MALPRHPGRSGVTAVAEAVLAFFKSWGALVAIWGVIACTWGVILVMNRRDRRW
jgi:hypothetical protein